jgi:HK97 family phage major capsid protein
MTTLDRLRAERDDLVSAAEALMEADTFDPSDSSYVELRDKASALDSKIQAIVDWNSRRLAADQIDAIEIRSAGRRSEQVRTTDADTPGSLFVRSREFAGYSFSGSSGRVEVPMLQMRAADVMKTTEFGGLPTRYDVSEPKGDTPVLSVVNRVPVSSGSIEYVKWTLNPNAAAAVAEGTAKPQSDLTRTVTPKSLPTVAHFAEATRQLLEDESAVRSIIDDELRWGVMQALETQAVTAVTGATIPTAEGDDLLSAIRIGIGALPSGYTATTVLLNPADWAALDLAVMAGGLGGPNMQASFFGLRPASSAEVDEGTAIVGDFRRAVTNWYRTGVQILATDSHASNFTSNIFTILGEARSWVDVVRPNGLVKVTVAAP